MALFNQHIDDITLVRFISAYLSILVYYARYKYMYSDDSNGLLINRIYAHQFITDRDDKITS